MLSVYLDTKQIKIEKILHNISDGKLRFHKSLYDKTHFNC